MKIYTVYNFNFEKYNYRHDNVRSFGDADKAIKFCNQKNREDADYRYQVQIEQLQE